MTRVPLDGGFSLNVERLGSGRRSCCCMASPAPP